MTGDLPGSGVVSGWRFLANNLRHRSLGNLTTLPRVLMRLTELGSLGDDDHGECYIRPLLSGVSLLDFDKFDELVDMGRARLRIRVGELARLGRSGASPRLIAPAEAPAPDTLHGRRQMVGIPGAV